MPIIPPDDFEEKPGEEGPPEPYNTWEEYFEDFDRQLEDAPQITVRQRIGNPNIRLADEIPVQNSEKN